MASKKNTANSAAKSSDRITGLSLQSLVQIAIQPTSSTEHRAAASQLLVSAFCGVDIQDDIRCLSLDLEKGWLLYRDYQFLPYNEDSIHDFLAQATGLGIKLSSEETLGKRCLQVFSLSAKMVPIFSECLNAVRSMEVGDQALLAVLRKAGLSRSLSLVRDSFLDRMVRNKLGPALGSVYLLPPRRVEPFVMPHSLLPATLFWDENLTSEDIQIDVW